MVVTLIIAWALSACAPSPEPNLEEGEASSSMLELPRTISGVANPQVLRILTANNAHCYYIYRDEARGFEHDLVLALAESLGLEAEFFTPPWTQLLDKLEHGEGDMIAASMTATPMRERDVAFSVPYMKVRQHVVVRKESLRIQDVQDLKGREIHVRAGTSYHQRLLKLKRRGIELEIVTHHDVSTEELLRRVSEGEIDITVADTNIARLGRRYYPNLVLSLEIGPPEEIAWAVAKGKPQLLARINTFLLTAFKDGTFDRIYNDYYASVETFDALDLTRFQERVRSRLPAFLDTLKEEAHSHDFDWRLIAAMMYQESRYDAAARSHTGVRGLMQLTLATAGEMGVTDRLDPVQSIRGGTKYLGHIYSRFDDLDDRNRILFALASYNVGRGHVLDAQQLARELGKDPDQWESMIEVLPMLTDEKYYSRARYGYCRGAEPVRYVARVLTYYDVLANEGREIKSD